MVSYRDWVVETSSTTGTGTYDLSGSAPAGTSYFTFRQRYANGEDEIVYWVVNADRTKWEKNRFGTLTYGSPDTLSRNVVESTAGDAPVSWVGGDTPLRIYVVPDADAEEFAITMGLGAARPGILKFGMWADEDDVSAGVHTLKLFDSSDDIPVAEVDTAAHTIRMLGGVELTGDWTFDASGVVDLLLATVSVATQAVGDNSNNPASTAFVQAAVGKVYLQNFSTSGTYTPHAGLTKALVIAVAAGGGGGGRANTGANVAAGGGGGGAGGISIRLLTNAEVGASQAVTIGAGGAAGDNTGAAAGTGGNTSLGSLVVANGGLGGDGNGNGGAGGSAGTGTIAGTGAPGGSVPEFTTTSGKAMGGHGGSSWLGGGGRGAVTGTTAPGVSAGGIGGGGGGAAVFNASGANVGTAGGNGRLFVIEFCNQ